jgi:sterol desaturase/sphingolipid hydroxylase (fatty acid hydroxylase superfamily)
MAKFVSNKNETIRLFKNPILEYFSHIHPVTPVIVFVPVLLLLSFYGYQEIGILNGTICFAIGILLWTLMEYIIHRWAFHYHPKSEAGKKIHFLVHGIHHDYPRDATRLVMPLLVSVPLAIFFYYLFSALFGVYNLNIFAGFIFGYVSYDSIHYATHHFKMEKGIGKFLKVYHLKHHYNDDHTAYGVSNPLWDYVFRTVPPQLKENKNNENIKNSESVSVSKVTIE